MCVKQQESVLHYMLTVCIHWSIFAADVEGSDKQHVYCGYQTSLVCTKPFKTCQYTGYIHSTAAVENDRASSSGEYVCLSTKNYQLAVN